MAAFFAWAYELTPEGLKKEKDVDRSQSIMPQTGRKLDFLIIAVLVLALGFFTSQRGDVYLRTLMIHGARAVVTRARHKKRPAQSLGHQHRHKTPSERGSGGIGQQDRTHGLGHAAQ